MPAPGATPNFDDAFENTATQSQFPGSAHHHYFSVTTSNTGGTASHNNIQPSIIVKRWRRIS